MRVRFAVEMVHVRVRVERWVKVERRKERKKKSGCVLLSAFKVEQRGRGFDEVQPRVTVCSVL